MKQSEIPTLEELTQHAQTIQEINPSAVIAMLRIMQASKEIKYSIIDVLEKDYQISEGKFHVMIILHKAEQGMAPSELADKVGVTRATISVMLRRMMRDNLVIIVTDNNDARSKRVCLTKTACEFMDRILPEHYLRITRLMGKLSAREQAELIFLLKKLAAD